MYGDASRPRRSSFHIVNLTIDPSVNRASACGDRSRDCQPRGPGFHGEVIKFAMHHTNYYIAGQFLLLAGVSPCNEQRIYRNSGEKLDINRDMGI